MKIWPFLFLLVSCHSAVILSPRNPDDAGAVVQFQNQDVTGDYVYGYSEGHPSGGSFHTERGDVFGNKYGSYGLKEIDGRIRVVRYVADANGFRVDVTSNEPGVAPQDPASATFNKPSIVPFSTPPVVPVAPVAAVPPPPPVQQKVFQPQPPPVSYNYLAPAPFAAPPPPPPPPAYFPPRFIAPLAAPVPAPVAPFGAPFGAPVAAKGVATYPAPPPPAYYTNLVPGKGFVNAIRTGYTSLLPPFAAVPPQFNYLNIKAPPPYQGYSYPL